MDKADIYTLLAFTLFTITVIGSVWLIKRVNPSNRIYWFIGYVIWAFLFLGIIRGLIAIIATLVLLVFIKKDNDNPIADLGSGFIGILALGSIVILHGVYMLLFVGGIYWLWLAIQLKSFAMFLVGVIPIAWIVTSPAGAYSLVMDIIPEWIIEWFS